MTIKKSRGVQPRQRAASLRQLQRLKMARSVHSFVRGSTSQFYGWLEGRSFRVIPNGPAVWICGDCHVGNLGPVADAKGRVEIEIRDLDQTVIGNPAYDLIRLGLSLATSIRSSDLPGVTTARMLEAMMLGYRQAFASGRDGMAVEHPKCLKIVMKRALGRTWKRLADERIGGVTPTIPLGKAFWPLLVRERVAVERFFEDSRVQRLVTSLKSRDDGAKVQLLDAAFWNKGCSSLGSLRIAVLLRVGDVAHDHDGLCLIDIKEAGRALAPVSPRATMVGDNAQRVVDGAAHLSPFLGGRMLSGSLLDRTVFLRELRPQDLKVELDHLDRADAIDAAAFLANVVGKAHARQMDATTRRDWCRQLQRKRLASVDAPSWLWSSVVNLIVLHEAAYLEHCRDYALQHDSR